jgi:hypothetical protein
MGVYPDTRQVRRESGERVRAGRRPGPNTGLAGLRDNEPPLWPQRADITDASQ